mmetsp:Transcript_37937/g.87612  ORF Transcript_37937/g.87612 Transcript_37937/m.87612 type:complete len:226 (+) Transcript_37937:507-1184(+)
MQVRVGPPALLALLLEQCLRVLSAHRKELLLLLAALARRLRALLADALNLLRAQLLLRHLALAVLVDDRLVVVRPPLALPRDGWGGESQGRQSSPFGERQNGRKLPQAACGQRGRAAPIQHGLRLLRAQASAKGLGLAWKPGRGGVRLRAPASSGWPPAAAPPPTSCARAAWARSLRAQAQRGLPRSRPAGAGRHGRWAPRRRGRSPRPPSSCVRQRCFFNFFFS